MRQRKFFQIKYTRRYSYSNFGTFFSATRYIGLSQKSKITHAYFTNFSVPVYVLILIRPRPNCGRGSAFGSAIRYVFPVLRMTSCFHIMERMGQNQRRVCLVQFARWQHQGRSLPSLTASCLCLVSLSYFSVFGSVR